MNAYKRITALIETLQQKGVVFFTNSNFVPSVHIPDDTDRQDWLVNSERFSDKATSLL